MKVSKLDMRMILLWIALFQFYLPNQKIYYVYQFFVAWLILTKSLKVMKDRLIYFIYFLYPLTIMISCIVNRNTILFMQVTRGFTNALLIMDMFLMIKQYESKRGVDKLFEIMYKMSGLYASLNVLWVIVLSITGNLRKAVQEEFLFSRGKFSTAYIFIFYLLFFSLAWDGNRCFPKKWKKALFIVQAIGCIVVCALIETSTGVLAVSMFLILDLYGRKILKRMENPFVVVVTMIISMFLVFGLSTILEFPIVQNIIINILHEDLSLTGRMELYQLLYPLVLKSGLWGGGFGSYVAATLAYHGWYNAQNGLAEIILTYGFVGGITFLLLVFATTAYSKNKNRVIYVAIYVFIAVAVVEIPYNSNFILLLALLQVRCENE